MYWLRPLKGSRSVIPHIPANCHYKCKYDGLRYRHRRQCELSLSSVCSETCKVNRCQHFYIHDLPLLASTNKTSTTEFESDFLEHLELLACPAQFITQVRSQYDFSSVKVSLVVSNQGAHSGLSAEKYGLLRLRALISRLEISAVSTLEYCAGSIGKLNAVWLNQFHNAATGGRADLDEDADLLPLTVVFPTPYL